MEASLYLIKYNDDEYFEIGDAKWIDASISHPNQDVEVIVLLKTVSKGIYKIAFGHIVDKSKCVDYNGWNIDGVMYWIPCPELPK